MNTADPDSHLSGDIAPTGTVKNREEQTMSSYLIHTQIE